MKFTMWFSKFTKDLEETKIVQPKTNMGRPKGAKKTEMRFSWKSFCKDLRNEPEFYVPKDNTFIEYRSQGDKIRVIPIENNQYQLFYAEGENEWIPCQTLKTGEDVYIFINDILTDEYDWNVNISGKIKIIK